MKRFVVLFILATTVLVFCGGKKPHTTIRSLGDLGHPPDYEHTILPFHKYIPEFDLYSKSLPASFDWWKQGKVTPAKSQGACGSCWAFASVGAMESKILIAGGPAYDLSEQQQVSCNKEMWGCNGGNMTALRFWYNEKPFKETCAPYEASDNVPCDKFSHCPGVDYNTTGYYTVTMDKYHIKTSIQSDGPGYFRFDVYEDFDDFWDNGTPGQVYCQRTGERKGGHAVLIIGWDDAKSAWKCKNSWGKNAGPNGDGTFWIAYSGHKESLRFGMANVRLTR